MIKIGINGFGRIGRLAARIISQAYPQQLSLVCINTSGRLDTAGWSHLFKHDSVYGRYPGQVGVKADKLIVADQSIPVLGKKEPAKIPWSNYGTQVVIESTGVFRTREAVAQHLGGSVQKVVLAAPPKDEQISMYVLGVNEKKLAGEQIISCASCTTNCVAPIVKVIDENFGIVKSLMTTIHAYTTSQELLDGSHQDLRRARAAAINLIPTSTGAARATEKIYPKIKEKFDGLAIRAPIAIGSLADFTLVVKEKTKPAEINGVLEKAAAGELKGIVGVTREPLVSSDIIGSKLSALVDLSLTKVVAGDLVKLVAWYDNEWGYANRLVEEVVMVGESLE